MLLSSGAPPPYFLSLCGVRHRVSSAHFHQSSGRAEVAVKKTKRLHMSNTGSASNLDHDCFMRAMFQLRYTPDPDCNVFPAQIVFGIPLRDAFSFVNRLEKFSNPNTRPLWRDAWKTKEDSLCSLMIRSTESLAAHARPIRPLVIATKSLFRTRNVTARRSETVPER